MVVKVGINGFGRIGRLSFRGIWDRCHAGPLLHGRAACGDGLRVPHPHHTVRALLRPRARRSPPRAASALAARRVAVTLAHRHCRYPNLEIVHVNEINGGAKTSGAPLPACANLAAREMPCAGAGARWSAQLPGSCRLVSRQGRPTWSPEATRILGFHFQGFTMLCSRCWQTVPRFPGVWEFQLFPEPTPPQCVGSEPSSEPTHFWSFVFGVVLVDGPRFLVF